MLNEGAAKCPYYSYDKDNRIRCKESKTNKCLVVFATTEAARKHKTNMCRTMEFAKCHTYKTLSEENN